ncbi:hypothetical protein [uncultured Massilia sp.]|uniref:hypothetical protein n=1 Tax=uncultured Massilia sp. TaxID=169973 RepID=UPI0025DB4815|nr:hypothetical protein [uncultured Massilia sp.]
MTLRGHTWRCLFVSAVALLAAALAILPDLDHALRLKTAACTAAALAGGFLVAQWLAGRDPLRPSGDLEMAALAPPVAGVAMMTLWLPVLLALAVVVLRTLGAEPVRVSWELIVIGGLAGQHAFGAWSFRGGR